MRSGQRVVVNADEDPAYAPYLHVVRMTGFTSVQATPIGAPQPEGVVSTFYRHAHAVHRQEAESLDRIAREAREVLVRLR